MLNQKHRLTYEQRLDRVKDFCFTQPISAYSCHVRSINELEAFHPSRKIYYQGKPTMRGKFVDFVSSKNDGEYAHAGSEEELRMKRLIDQFANTYQLDTCQKVCVARCVAKAIITDYTIDMPVITRAADLALSKKTNQEVLQNGHGVCRNYVKLQEYLLDKMEVPFTRIEQELHYFNEVMIGEKSYISDAYYREDVTNGMCDFYVNESAPQQLLQPKEDYAGKLIDELIRLNPTFERRLVKGISDISKYNIVQDKVVSYREDLYGKRIWVKTESDKQVLQKLYEGRKFGQPIIKDGGADKAADEFLRDFQEKSFISVLGDEGTEFFRIVSPDRFVRENDGAILTKDDFLRTVRLILQ